MTSSSAAPSADVSVELTHILSIAWFVGLAIVMFLQPAPAVETPPTALDHVIANGFFGTVLLALVGLAMRRRWGALASLGASGLLAAIVIACPVTGHHTFGAWWITHAVAAVALIALSGAALLRRPA